MRQFMITLIAVLVVLFCSALAGYGLSFVAVDGDTWCPVHELYTHDFKVHQDEAELLMDGLESIELLQLYLIERLANFDHNDHGKLELRIKTLTYLLNEVNRAHKDVLDSITRFVKDNTDC